MWKKNENNFLFAAFEVKGKNPQSIAELSHKATLKKINIWRSK